MTFDIRQQHMDSCAECGRWAPFELLPNGLWQCQFCYATAREPGARKSLLITPGDPKPAEEPEHSERPSPPTTPPPAAKKRRSRTTDAPHVTIARIRQPPKNDDGIRAWEKAVSELGRAYSKLDKARDKMLEGLQHAMASAGKAHKREQLGLFKRVLAQLVGLYGR